MRSEEGPGGLGAALSMRGPSWREKLSGPEVQFRRESPRREPTGPPTSPFTESGAGKPREEKRTALSKVGAEPHGLSRETGPAHPGGRGQQFSREDGFQLEEGGALRRVVRLAPLGGGTPG